MSYIDENGNTILYRALYSVTMQAWKKEMELSKLRHEWECNCPTAYLSTCCKEEVWYESTCSKCEEDNGIYCPECETFVNEFIIK